MPHPQAKIHRMFELVEPIGAVSFSEAANEAFLALGMRNYWDGYFAGRAAPLGPASAEVVHAAFYNFADGEVSRHIPWVWGKTTPQEAIAVRERGSTAALRRMIGELADSPGLVRVAELATRAAVSAPIEGRALYAGLRALEKGFRLRKVKPQPGGIDLEQLVLRAQRCEGQGRFGAGRHHHVTVGWRVL